MSDPAPPLEGFSVEPFAFEGREYPVYWGGAGPGVDQLDAMLAKANIQVGR